MLNPIFFIYGQLLSATFFVLFSILFLLQDQPEGGWIFCLLPCDGERGQAEGKCTAGAILDSFILSSCFSCHLRSLFCSLPFAWHLLCLILKSAGLSSLGTVSSPTLQPLTRDYSHLFFTLTVLPVCFSVCLRFSLPSPPSIVPPLSEGTDNFQGPFSWCCLHSHCSFKLLGSCSSLFWAVEPLSDTCPFFSAPSQHPYILTVVCHGFISVLFSFFLHTENIGK